MNSNKQLIEQHEEMIGNLRIELIENSDGFWEKSTYNQDSKLIKTENSDGYRFEFTYDQNNNLIESEESDGYWEKYTYDQSNNLIKSESGYIK